MPILNPAEVQVLAVIDTMEDILCALKRRNLPSLKSTPDLIYGAEFLHETENGQKIALEMQRNGCAPYKFVRSLVLEEVAEKTMIERFERHLASCPRCQHKYQNALASLPLGSNPFPATQVAEA